MIAASAQATLRGRTKGFVWERRCRSKFVDLLKPAGDRVGDGAGDRVGDGVGDTVGDVAGDRVSDGAGDTHGDVQGA